MIFKLRAFNPDNPALPQELFAWWPMRFTNDLGEMYLIWFQWVTRRQIDRQGKLSWLYETNTGPRGEEYLTREVRIHDEYTGP